MKKKYAYQVMVLGMAAVMALSLAACGGQTSPSSEEVQQAIEAGTLTVEDALNKGLVDQAWVDAYYEANSVPASNKMEAHAVGEFTTQTLDGETFTRDNLGSTVYFAFADPAAEGTETFFQALVEAYEGVTESGAEIVLCAVGDGDHTMFADAPFPVILYNDSLSEAMGNNRSMVEDGETPNTGAWYVNGAFLSAWSLAVDADDLAEDAAAFVEMSQEDAVSTEDESGNDGAAVMVPMS